MTNDFLLYFNIRTIIDIVHLISLFLCAVWVFGLGPFMIIYENKFKEGIIMGVIFFLIMIISHFYCSWQPIRIL